MEITAKDVNELRKQTGAGMMDCKKALVEANGDMEAAIDYLRKKGQKVSADRAGRQASEGVVIAKTSDDATTGILVLHLANLPDHVGQRVLAVRQREEVVEVVALHSRPAEMVRQEDRPAAVAQGLQLLQIL